MGLLGLGILVVVGLVAGFAVQLRGGSRIKYEWLIVAVSVVFGGYFASESFPGSNVFSGIKDWGPANDGLTIIPAVVGAPVLSDAADLGMRGSPEVSPA